MSSNACSATIDLRPRPSLRALQVIVGLHVIAAILAFIARPPDHLGLAMSVALMLSWFRLRRHPAFGFGRRALSRLTWHADGPKWTVESAAGGAVDAALLPSTRVTRFGVVLNFRLADGRRRSRVLLGDELDADTLRRLRLRLLAGDPLARPAP